MAEEPELQIIISSGPEDSRSTLGFAAALSAAACGTPVVIFLALGGVRWALKTAGTEPQQAGFPAVSEMLDAIQASGGRVEVCSNCLDDACSLCTRELCTAAPVDMPARQMRDGIHPGGLAAVAARMSQIPTVSF